LRSKTLYIARIVAMSGSYAVNSNNCYKHLCHWNRIGFISFFFLL